MIKEEEKKKRLGYLGGSDMACVQGHGFKTAYELWEEKTGRAVSDIMASNERIHFGNALEGVIIEEYVRRSEGDVTLKFFDDNVLRHPEFDFIAGHPDAIEVSVTGEGIAIIEAKNVAADQLKLWGDDGTSDVPMKYQTQVDTYMACEDVDVAHICVLFGGNMYREYHIHRSEEREKVLIDKACWFWDLVQTDTPPPLTEQDDIGLVYPQDNGIEMQADAEMLKTIKEFAEADANAKEYARRAKALSQQIKIGMGEHDTISDGNNSPLVTYRTQGKSGVDVASLKKEMPEIASKYTKDSTVRVLRQNKKNIGELGG